MRTSAPSAEAFNRADHYLGHNTRSWGTLAAAALLVTAAGWGPATAGLVDETAARLGQTVTDATYAVVAVDVDGDGDPDVVVANQGQLRLLINTGGVFADETAARLPVTDVAAFGVDFGDADGDGDPDLFVANATGASRLLINDGAGQFTDQSGIRLPAGLRATLAGRFADLDGDGDLDLVLGNRGHRNQLLTNSGAGVFTEDTAGRLAPDTDLTYDVEIADVTGDGAPDLLFANHGTQSRLFINNGLGFFSDETAAQLPAAAPGSLDASFFDADADGDLDLALAEGADGVRLLLNNGNGVFATAGPGRLPLPAGFPLRLTVGDVDYDGSPDLVLAQAGQDRLLLNSGAGTFTDATGAWLPADASRSFGLALFDADGDFDADLLVAVPWGQNRLLINRVPFPRIRIATSPAYIEVGTPVTVRVQVFDEDGVGSTELTVDGVPLALSPDGTATFAPSAPGLHEVSVRAVDALGNGGTRSTRVDVQSADTSPPAVAVTVTPPAVLFGEVVNLRVTATDDRGVATRGLTVNGAAVPLDSAGNAAYAASTTGLHTAEARARDAAGNEGTGSVTFTVNPDALAPVVTVTAAPDPVDLTLPVTIAAAATDNVRVAALTATVTGPGAPGGLALVLDGSGLATYTPFQPGTYAVVVRALDPSGNEGTATTHFEAVGVPDTTAPAVSLTVAPRTVALGSPVSLTVTATDDVGVVTRALEINGTPRPLDGSGSATYTPAAPGTYTAVARARDAVGNETVVTDTFRAVDPAGDTVAPTVAITSPGEDAELAGLTDILGTAADPTLVRYALAYAPVGTANFTEFAVGDVEVVGGRLGTLDPTLLPNGLYEIRLTARDINGRTAVASVVVSATSPLKVGAFTLSFQDKVVAVGAFPLTVTRNYDSRDKTRGDFGIGWKLGLNEAVLVENRSPSSEWKLSVIPGFIPTYRIDPTRPHTVEIRLNEKEKVRFRARTNPESQRLYPIEFLNSMDYVPLEEGTGTLTVSEQPFFFIEPEVYSGDLDPYDPATFTYTAPDGFRYVFTETGPGSLRHALASVTDPSGNTLTLTPTGVTRSDGKNIQFVRDALGRVTRLTDPNGNAITYGYDALGDLASVTDPLGNVTRFTYDTDHNLVQVLDPLGRPVQRQEFDDDGRLIAITDAAGQRIEIEYDLTARTQIVRDRRGNPTIYEYDAVGNVTQQTKFVDLNEDGAADPAVTAYTYDTDGNLTSQTDPTGVVTANTFDPRGNLLSRTVDEAVGGLQLTTTFTYDSAGRVLTQTDPRGGRTTNAYDPQGKLVSRTDRKGITTTYGYDGSGQLTRETNHLGHYTEYGYDSVGARIREERFAAGGASLQKKEFTYDANGNKLTETLWVTVEATLTAVTTTFAYDANDRLVTVTDPLGGVKRTEYDPLGRVIAEVDPLGQRTEHTYDGGCASGCSTGKPVRVDYPDGTATGYGYDPDGNRNRIVDRSGNSIDITYDALNSPVRVAFGDGTSRRSVYDGAGRLVAELDENGNRTDHQYDGAGRRTQTRQPEVYDGVRGAALRPETLYEYDENGNRTALVDANGNRTVTVYDAENRPAETHHPGGAVTTTTYDALGREIATTDASGQTTTREYDGVGRLVRVTLPPPVLGGAAPVTRYTYDEAGNLLTQTDANAHVTTFAVDALGRRTGRTLPGGEVETFAIDAVGRITRHVDFNGAETLYTYGFALGGGAPPTRWERVESPDSTVTTVFGGVGERLLVTDARGDTTFGYDARGRLVEVAEPGGQKTAYRYDPRGNQARVTVTNGAATTYDAAYAYDPLNRLDWVSQGGNDTTYVYDAVGNRVLVTLPNGAYAEYTYNRRNQLTRLVNQRADDSVLSSYAYALDPNGLRTRVDEGDGSVVAYGYDGNHRLVIEARTGTNPYAHGYSYDAVGNRTAFDTDGDGTNDFVYSYDANDRLLSDGAFTYGYDNNGNRTAKQNLAGTVTLVTYEYDAANRLVRSVDYTTAPGGIPTAYAYDPEGNRLTKTDPTGTAAYVVDRRNVSGLPQVVAERDASGGLSALYTYGHDLLSQDRGGVSYFHYDGLGSTRLLSNAAGAVTDTYTYDGYGRAVAVTGTTVNAYRFAGEPFDPNVGLYYLRARYYDPQTGRFVSMDSNRGDPQAPASLHRYLYANDNPINFVDPTGRFTLIEVSISIGIQNSLQSIYTQNLMKFFFKAVEVAFCVLEPAYSLQTIGFDMMMRNLPGGEQLLEISQRMIQDGFQQIGTAIIDMYRAIGTELIPIKIEISSDLQDYIDAISSGDWGELIPLPEEVQKIIDFKEKLEGYLNTFTETLQHIQVIQGQGNNCEKWKSITALAGPVVDKLAGLL